jgi:hypothetical protein
MRFEDLMLLGKKIVVGVVITGVPLAILAGGLWFTQRVAGNHWHAKRGSSAKEMSHAN